MSVPLPSEQTHDEHFPTLYMWSVGALGLVLVIVFALLKLSVFDSFGITGFQLSSDFFTALTLVVTAILCNQFLFFAPPNIYTTLAMLVYMANFLIFPAVPAAIVALVPAVVFELFQARRGLVYAARTAGLYICATMLARLVFEWLGGGPVVGDIGAGYLLAVLGGFVSFRVVYELVITAGQPLRKYETWVSLRQRLLPASLAYLAMLPGSIVLALLRFQTGFFAFALFCGMTVGAGIVMKRFSDLRRNELQRLDEVEKLNSRLGLQNERQVALGDRIDLTLEGFLNLVREYAGISQEQEAAIIEITATVEQLSRTAGQIASSADNVSGAAERAIETAERGQHAVEDTIEAINEAREKAQEIATKILDLNDKSEKIGEIVTTINAIANEIRLLALNATIEASGAGPYGRRFAVVAGEVNALADRSRQAALEIRQIIAEIQSATTSSVRVTEEGLQRMERSVATATQSELANQEIIHQVERTAQAAAAISLATQQQRSASEQVVTSMHSVAIMIGQNAEKVASVSVASLELQRIVRELRAEE